MTTTALYDLIFVVAVMLLVAASASAVASLRWAFRHWSSIWLKTAIIHVVNFIFVFMFVVPFVLNRVPLFSFVEMTNGAIVDFCLSFLAADALRCWRKSYLKKVRDKKPIRRFEPEVLFLIVLLLGILQVRRSVHYQEGINLLEANRSGGAIFKGPSIRSPDREIIFALRNTFPSELDGLSTSYLAEASGSSVSPQPDFLVAEADRFVLAHRADIARAPDTALANVAQASAGQFDYAVRRGWMCGSFANDGRPISGPGVDDPASDDVKKRAGELTAALIFAAKAGIDHPVERQYSVSHLHGIEAQFRKSLSGELLTALDHPDASTGQERCHILAARLHWIAALDSDDAAYILSTTYARNL